jgi:uncharacterized delta-60 repeat protein
VSQMNKVTFILCVLLLQMSCLASEWISRAQAQTCARQADGKIVVAGSATINNSDQCVVARYTDRGILDNTFGNVGIKTNKFGSYSQIQMIGIQSSDQKIISIGNAYIDDVAYILLNRYDVNGVLDSQFGNNGTVTSVFEDGSSASAFAFDENGKIVVVGVRTKDGTPHLLLVRYNTDGSVDDSFGINGIVVTEIGFHSRATDIIIQDDGTILVSGYTLIDSQNLFVLAKYSTNGSPDITFGSQGIVTTPLGSTAQALSMARDSAGNIILAGASDKNLALVRYTSAGVLDATFNGNGILIENFHTRSQANAVVVDENDAIVVAGYVGTQLLLARYTNAGVLDSTFGDNATGYILFFLSAVSAAADVIIQPDGNIVVAGSADKDFLVLRYSHDGIADNLWGFNGIVSGPGGNISGTITQIWEQLSMGINAGTFTADVWQTRTLNIINASQGNRVTLNNNQFTLPAGQYSIYISAPAYKVGNHQIRLRNVTDDATELVGTSAVSSVTSESVNNSLIDGLLSLNKSCAFEVQHRCSISEPVDGLGVATGFGENEIYTTVKIINK